MTQYNDGRRFEYKVRDALREDGYEVLRSAGSKTKIDLVAMKTGQLVFVQCKLNGLCAPAERARLRELAQMVGALPIVAYSHKEGRPAAEVRYRLLTGDGPKAFTDWFSDVLGHPAAPEAGEFLAQLDDTPYTRREEFLIESGYPWPNRSELLGDEQSVTVSGPRSLDHVADGSVAW